MKKILVVAIATLSLSACANTNKPSVSDGQVKTYLASTLQEMQDTIEAKEYYLVLDVRTASEYQQGHLKHAINISADKLAENLSTLQKRREDNIIVYANNKEEASQSALYLASNIKGKNIYVSDGVNEYQYNLYTQNNVFCDALLASQDDSDVVILDARSVDDYNLAHLKGAINVPNADITADIQQQIDNATNNGKKRIITHCYRGNNANKLANTLIKLGYNNVTSSIDGSRECDFVIKP